ncbi:MAG: hypothetical protein M1819_000132 [Sarea resinae]|nr:MAG: hypothetical protein M1819_000132 [Sarea resinae]
MSSSSDEPPHHPSTPQSIPLQDLSRAPGSRSTHGKSDSGKIRNLLGNRQSLSGRGAFGKKYERVEGSPSPPDRHPLPNASPTAGPSNLSGSPYDTGSGDVSPVAHPGAFQEAMGFAGLSLGGHSSVNDSQGPLPLNPAFNASLVSEDEGIPPFVPAARDLGEPSQGYFPSLDTDTTRLTDIRHLQPISGAQPPSPGGQSQERSSFQSVRFATPEGLSPGGISPGSRLGDDLRSLEAGHLGAPEVTRSRSRSLSPSAAGSTLFRAGSVVRKMSQRVVNLSNEPEIVEQSIRRKSSMNSARMDEPPDIPAITAYAHDGGAPPSPFEKEPPVVVAGRVPNKYQDSNPLKGKSLGIFSADNPLRVKLCDILVHPATEPFILLLIVFQTILLTIESGHNVFHHPRSKRWGTNWIDRTLLCLFVVYTFELIARIIVSGFVINAAEYSTVDRQLGFKRAVYDKYRNFLTPQRQPSRKTPSIQPPQPSILRSFTNGQMPVEDHNHTRHQQRHRLARRAFLRHSFNRLDFVAVVSFWISFALGSAGIESSQQIYVFRMLSCLRILRLLGITNGTSVILRSLKKAAPMLVNVAFLIGFFWLLFAIIGVQSFKSSLRRTCVWVDPEGQEANYTSNVLGNFQFCGGHLDRFTGDPMPWVFTDGRNGTDKHKGYLCPQNSYCVQGSNPYNGTVSFDNVFHSLELVFVIMSSNTFSDLLYYTTDSDYLAAALFFAAGIVIMSLWLTNLLVAVITSSFQVIREESKASAFAPDERAQPMSVEETPQRPGPLKRLYDMTAWFWILVIVYGLVVQCLRSADMGEDRRKFIDITELAVSIVLLFEIVARFLTDWRNFFLSKRNWADLVLAVITMIIQIPSIHNSGRPYAWLTIFQILRIHRVVMAFPITRKLIEVVLRNARGLLNLILFVFLITFLVAIFAVQIFRGEIPREDLSNSDTIRITFGTIYNSFLGMYQVLSSENWTYIMYYVTEYESHFNTAWIGAAFFILWFILANFIVLNMFIAVIQESFDVTEDEKRMQQVKAFLQRKELGGSSHGNLSLSAIFKMGRYGGRHRDPLDYGAAPLEMLLKDAVVKDFLDDNTHLSDAKSTNDSLTSAHAAAEVQPGSLSAYWGRLVGLVKNREPNPFYSRLQFSRAYEELDPRTMAKEVVSANEQRKRAQREYLVKHPNYNVSLYLFKPSNPIRKICQRIVGPGRGSQRIEGVDPIKAVWYSFSAFIYAAIVAMVLLACVTTPLYQREYFLQHENSRHSRNWFVYSDMGFAILFTVEAIIKVIADGFFWTPNAYFRGTWGFIDGVVLVTLWINVLTTMYNEGPVSRAIGAFKALRALRLLNVSDSARDTFHSVIILGGWNVVSAALVSISLLIPFALYGLNLFNGQMLECNDGNSGIVNLIDCVGEYQSSPYGWNVLAPRQYSNPYYSFDNFGSSLFILFQIVSQEGWTDVMWSAESMTGRLMQPQPFASQGNAVFFVVFNLLGAVFVLTLFTSVFMRNYTEQTGVAFLTAEQRSWLELRKLLRRISPSKRPPNRPNQTWRNWCYRRAVQKHGRWQRFITVLLCLHLVLLIIEFYPEPEAWDKTREYIFLTFTVIYIANIVIRIVGLSWKRFRKSSWDFYSLLAVSGTFVTTIFVLADPSKHVYEQLHKLFLVSIALLLIPRNNQLDQLFKTAAASLTAIGNLLATWFVLFLVYAIALTQTFGLTRFGSNETGNLNFRTVPKALILLFRMSCGEGWNQIMEDFAMISEPNCVGSSDFFWTDCGSESWARGLFISWNILSMYIFVSLFVSLIFESFSYVYQRSSGLGALTREEIRRYKQAWAMFDPEGTGFISKEAFPRLLGELSGLFEMRIYDGEFTVGSILEECRIPRRNSEVRPGAADDVDLEKLRQKLAQIPVQEIRARRRVLALFYEEIMFSADPERGISFNSILMIMIHYRVINDSKSLGLEEFLRRRARLQRVEEDINRSVVLGFVKTVYWRTRLRRTLEHRSLSRMEGVPQFAVPEIFVDDEDDIAATKKHYSDDASFSPILSPTDPFDSTTNLTSNLDARTVSPPGSITLRRRSDSRSSTQSREQPQANPQLFPHRPSASEGGASGHDWQLAGGLSGASSPRALSDGERSRKNSNVSARDVLEVLDNSAWGESIRRSFTTRRPG